ncbi:MAG: hypothetical protein LBU03_00410 [Tannerellaceae bacterium]|jgi:hypothetical protein|nr:hypothetical protein [Tannerellaceae bacterium]
MKMIKKYVGGIGLLILFLGGRKVFGQESVSERLNREMTLEREYNPTVQDADKVNTLSIFQEKEMKRVGVPCVDTTFLLLPEREFDIRATQGMAVEMMSGSQRGYLHFAGGMLMSFNGDAVYRLVDTETDQLGVAFSHHSTNGERKYLHYDGIPSDVKEVKAKWNDNLAELNYSHRLDGGTKIRAGAEYNYTGFNYYGNPVLRNGTPPDDGQVMQLFKAKVGVNSIADAERLCYRLDVDYRNFSYGKEINGVTDIAEQMLALDFDANITLLGEEEQRFGISGELRTHFNIGVETSVSPYYKLRGKGWQALLGANFAFLSGEKKTTMVSPNIAASWEVARRTVIYAETHGALCANTGYDISRINPFAAPIGQLTPSRQWLDGRLGLRSGAPKGGWLDVFIGCKMTDDDYLFFPDKAALPLRVMEKIDTRLFFIGTTVRYSYGEWVETYLKAVFNQWEVIDGNEEVLEVYERPKAEVAVGVRLFLSEKLTFSMDYKLIAGRKSRFLEKDIHLQDIHALHLNGGYALTETLSAHLELNNILFRPYELFYGHPLRSFHTLAGFSFTF